MSTTSNYYNQQTNTTDPNKPGYVQSAYKGAASLASSAANAFSGSGSGAGVDSTTQYRNDQQHAGGVGDMGTNSQSDISRLPEERANPDPLFGKSTDTSMTDPALTDPSNIQQRLNARDPPVPYPESGSGAAAPSENQFRNQQPHVGGVGDLGTRSEADVVRAPEERANPDPFANSSDVQGQTNVTSAGIGSSGTGVGYEDENGLGYQEAPAKSWDSRGHAHTAHDVTQPGHSGGITGSNFDRDHGLGHPHRDDSPGRAQARDVGGRAGVAAAMDLDANAYKQTDQQGGDFTSPGVVPGHHGDYGRAREEASALGGPAAGGMDFGPETQKQMNRQGDDTDTRDTTAADNQDESDNEDQTSPGGTRKVSMGKKLKGNLLIAKGKLTKGTEEVEQGKHLKQTGEMLDKSEFTSQ